MIAIFAAGTPRPKGSKRQVRTKGGRTLMLEDSKREGPWRDSVSQAAHVVMRIGGHDRYVEQPLAVRMVFGFQRPKKHYLRHGLRADAPVFHTGKPDSSKLARSVEDALNGIVWDDDSRIAQLFVEKIYVEADTSSGIALATWPAVTAFMTDLEYPVIFYRRLAGAPPEGLVAFAAEARTGGVP